MLDKKITFKTISQVLKKEILPNLTDEMAKEQTVALLALLKNLDANTVPSEEPYKHVNKLLLNNLDHVLSNMPLNKIEVFKQELAVITFQYQSERLKWEALNKLFSDIIQYIYQNRELHPLIPEVRKTIRKQLEIERKKVF